ncbi:MAG: DUF6057 family protein [Mangrovibacterium sp.]
MNKNNLLSRILKPDQLLTFTFGLVVYLFFSLGYAYHLNYQEQFQLFLFTTDYLTQYLGYPGGISDYLGNFITQFYFYSFIGAILLAVMLSLLQRTVWSVAQKLGAASYWIPLSFIPSVLYWSLLCDESYLAGGLVALMLVSASIRLFLSISKLSFRLMLAVFSIPALYWLAGGAVMLLPVFAITRELTIKELKPATFALFSIGIVGLSVALPFLAKQLLVQLPFTKLLIGATYYRYPVIIPYSVALIGLLIVFLPFLSKVLSYKLSPQKPALWLAVQMLFLVSSSYFLISKTADLNKEEVMEYDFHARMRRWDRIIEKADRQAPTSPLSVTCLNLALAKQDLLGERMFHYYQNGMGGLLPDFTRDFTIPTILGEVYYHLGFINTAQRLAFEAMEALPDYQKSARSVMRLAETNLINGNYELAGKYLRLLQKTFYYRKWATNALRATKNESLIEEHPEWGFLRKVRTQEDFLFSEGEKEMMLGTVFLQNQENRMAFEYLMACCLLKKDLQHFMEYYPVGKALNYRVVPKSYQEALIYVWGLSHDDPTQSIPYPISNSVKMRVKNYANIYTTRQNAEALLHNDYSDTYWYYLHFRN